MELGITVRTRTVEPARVPRYARRAARDQVRPLVAQEAAEESFRAIGHMVGG